MTYEGQAAIELEQLAAATAAAPWEWRFGDGDALIARCSEERADGRDRSAIAAAFHETVAEGAAAACSEAEGPGTVVLSGGTFQNLRLLGSLTRRLESRGFRVLRHRLVPPNDGGVSLGQAAVAAARLASRPA